MNDKKEILLGYIKANVTPLLVDFISSQDIEDAVVIPAKIDIEELNGHYEETNFVPPKWFSKLLSQNTGKILIIDRIDTISKEEQLKFVELLEYRKISTFELPDNCIILVTAKEINKDKISEEIFSLVARI